MKKLFLVSVVCVFLFVSFSYTMGQWNRHDYGSYDYEDVHFTDKFHGYFVGESSDIYATTDSGATFFTVSAGAAMNGIFFVDETTGWAAGTGGKIVKTTDGGTSWTAQTSSTGQNLFDIHFADSLHGWAVGYSVSGGTIIHTADSGGTWATQTSVFTATALNIEKVFGIDSLTALCVGSSQIQKTTDGGTNWVLKTNPSGEINYGIYFIDSNTGWIGGDNGTIMKTTDGGENWSVQTTGTLSTNEIFDIHFVDSNIGWAVGRGVIAHTTDGGVNWSTETVGGGLNANAYIQGVHFVDRYNGWACGFWGLDEDILIKYSVPDVNVTLLDTIAKAGDTINFPINLSNIEQQIDSIVSFEFKVGFDTSLVELIGFDTVGYLAGGFSIDTNFIVEDTLTIAAAGTYPISSSGILMKLKLVLDSAMTMYDTVTVNLDSLVFNEGLPIANVTEGKIYVQGFKYGDVDLDDAITTTDASEILKYRVGKVTLSDTALIAADVSGNGTVFAYDAALILRYIAILISDFPAGSLFAPKPALYKDAYAELMTNVMTEQNIEYYIRLNNVTETYSADITLNYDNSVFELKDYELIDAGKHSLIEGNNVSFNGELKLAMITLQPITDNRDIIKLKFKVNGKLDGKVPIITSFVVNEEEIGIKEKLNIPKVYALHQNYPNPFNPETTIKFDLPGTSDVTLKIYNIIGQEIKTLINERKNAGYHSIKWDGTNNFGTKVSSGIYIYRMKTNTGYVKTRKLVFLK
ncbi:YCF48-related protein [candidate division KSB1 bacterium]